MVLSRFFWNNFTRTTAPKQAAACQVADSILHLIYNNCFSLWLRNYKLLDYKAPASENLQLRSMLLPVREEQQLDCYQHRMICINISALQIDLYIRDMQLLEPVAVGLFSLVTSKKKGANCLSCTRGGVGWTLRIISSPKRWSSPGQSQSQFLKRFQSHEKCSAGSVETMTLEVFCNLYDPTFLNIPFVLLNHFSLLINSVPFKTSQKQNLTSCPHVFQ